MPGRSTSTRVASSGSCFGPVPGEHPGGGVGAEDEEALARRIASSQLSEGVDHVARPAPAQLEIGHDQALEALDGGLDHGQAVGGRR